MSLYDQIARGFNPLQGLENQARIRLEGEQLKNELEQRAFNNQLTRDKLAADTLWKQLKYSQNERSAGETGTSVNYYRIPDDKGGWKYIPYQAKKVGGKYDIELPPGAEAVLPGSSVSFGGSVGVQNRLGGNLLGDTQKTVPPEKEIPFVEKSSQAKAEGKSRGEDIQDTRNNLGKTTQQANYSIQLLEQLKNHPGLPYATGIYSVMPRIPGTAQADFIARVEQLQGATFLQAYQQLKGGGHITEIEGEKAQNAVARMQRSQSREEFIKAADEYIGVIRDGLLRARKKAQNGKQVNRGQAPQAAIDYLKQNPQFKAQFIQKYRYLPEGF
ncbi:MAG: hypothetical protein AB2799_19125 [Candidatus Thiodiazotropha sp.]